MRIFIICIIKAYWFLIPAHKRNKCIFKESCSCHVYRVADKQGFLNGLKALYYRYLNFRPGYYIINGPEGKLFISARSGVFEMSEISEKLL